MENVKVLFNLHPKNYFGFMKLPLLPKSEGKHVYSLAFFKLRLHIEA